jgi:hypothetical protein
MDSGKSAAGKQSKPSHFDAAARGATAKHRFITPEPGESLVPRRGDVELAQELPCFRDS